ncbi:DUF6443 domain-containing protein [Larkinella sp. VNQ87]|uniref:DUF6443 domain-containing protein n=1 Tax=Larkinella sp. VNQ87 TaxID=3400921 RepID=UPI003C082025
MLTILPRLKALLFSIAWLPLFFPGKLYAQDNTRTYILTRSYKEAKTDYSAAVSGNVAQMEVQYLDGLGRPLQTVGVQAGKAGVDVVSPVEYDPVGRLSKSYRPGPTTVNTGTYQSAATSLSQAYYHNDRFTDKTDRSYAETTYEPSPLNRIKSTIGPGTSSPVSYEYGVNAANAVKKYKAGSGINDITEDGTYAANQLTSVKTTDESGKVSIEYKDKEGLTVLKTVGDVAFTYYVYDDLNQLRAVLQPQLQTTFSAATVQQFAFLYHYNDRGLLDQKHVPGTVGVSSYEYNSRDLLTRTVDPNNYSVYTEYDPLNRPIRTYNAAGDNLSYTYYDHYDHTIQTGGQLKTTLAFSPTQLTWTASGDFVPSDIYANRKNQVTGGCVRLVRGDGTLGDWKCSATYYDDKLRVVQTVRQMTVSSSARERLSYKRTFDGRVLQEKTVHDWSGDVSIVEKTYKYDLAARLIGTRMKTSGRSLPTKDIFINAQAYSEVGQLATKYLHTTSDAGAGAKATLTYKYDVRGWLRNLSAPSPNYSIGLNYESNGNISTMSWQHPNSSGAYQFSYDGLNRMTAGRNGSGTGENLSYSLNGNISSLQRYEGTTQVDNLTYSYDGNRLKKVTDTANNAAGFNNGSSGSNDDYTHDANGNTLSDANRSATMAYNWLNLPRRVTINGKTLDYVYETSGVKRTFNNNSSPTSYEGIFEYDGGNNVTRIATEEGQLVKVNGVWQWQYYLRDHLGNVRVVMNENGQTVQQSEYQPFGLAVLKAGIVGDNKYLYNGKEAQPETNWLDYGARMYDPAVGRWMAVDPVAESFESVSPYNYALNNPLVYIDPAGDSTYHVNDLNLKHFNPEKDDVQLDEVTVTSKGRELQTWNTSITDEQYDQLQESLKETVLFLLKLNLPSDYSTVVNTNGRPVYASSPSFGGVNNIAKTGASLSINGAKLSRHLEQLEKYGKANYKQLQNGRIRYYGNVTQAEKPGEMIGRRVVREWDPATGKTRTWMETLDGDNRVRIIRPETGGTKVHFMFDQFGKFTEKW